MSNNADKLIVGKQFLGQEHAPIRTPEDVQASLDAQKPYANKEGAISFAVYCARINVRDPVRIAGMRAYTIVNNATYEDWQRIFKDY